MVGNFIADSIRGKNFLQFEEKIAEGIIMHREIDTFTDSHPVVSRSKNLLRKEFNHYSGVIVDVFYDYFLAKNFSKYSDEELLDFTKRAYKIFHQHFEILPERNKNILKFMEANNWLLSYATTEGIDRALTGMSRRVKHESGMERATFFLIEHEKEFESHFNEFFPQMILHLKEKMFLPEN